MTVWFTLLLFITFTVLAIQDFKSRTIHWIPLPVIFILLLINGLNYTDSYILMLIIFLNIIFVILEILGIWFYIRFKNGRTEKIIDRYIGLGDVLLLLAISPAFVPLNFVLFVSFTALAAIIFYSFLHLSKIQHNRYIPLATFIGIFFNIILLTEYFLGTGLRYQTIQLLLF